MAHLWSFRQGWQSENLARYILYQFSFMAQPLVTSADDIGTDFFCTLFQVHRQDGTDYLLPTNAFAIQVKSNDEAFDVTNKLQYFENLELPYFVGVVDRSDLSLTLYSGEYLPALFSYLGVPAHLEIRLCSRDEIDSAEDYIITIDERERRYALRCPERLTFTAHMDITEVRERAERIGALCKIMLYNISAKSNHEYSFVIPLGDVHEGEPFQHQVVRFSGPTSIRYFRRNLLLRISEALGNLEWLRVNNHPDYDQQEHEAWREVLRLLEASYGDLPLYQVVRNQE